MPASARKSSLGNLRRGPQKYIPYRADDFQHGKKTGIAVGYVERMSDDFEPFEKVMSQADNRTPLRPQVVRKKRGPKTPVVVHEEPEDDVDGEMSMELEDSIPNSPSAYFAHTRAKQITSSVQRVGSSSRPVAHTSDVDFDEVPSPRASPSYAASTRKSLPHNRSIRSPGPSRLSHSTVLQEDSDSDSAGGGALDYGDYGNNMDDQDDDPRDITITPRTAQASSRRTTFAQIEQETDEEAKVEEEIDYDRSPSAKARGKQRASYLSPPPPEDDMEPEIEQGLQEVEQELLEEDEGEEEPPSRRGKKGKEAAPKVSGKENPTKPREKPQPRKKVVLRELTPDDPNSDGLRRSKRLRYSPLAWWRLEKVVYGRRESGTSLVPSIKEIHRIPQIKPEPLGAKRRKGGHRKKSQTVEPEVQQVVVYDPEEGWDDETDPYCNVLEFGEDGREVSRRVAFTAKMVAPKAAGQGAFYFQKIFGDGDFLAAGQLIIPPNSTKPTKGTKDNTFVFYVIQGAVKFAVHQSNFVLSTGGMFMVPRGNIYYIQNICDRDAKLFFAQARKMPDEIRDEGSPEVEHRSRSRSTAVVQRRESTGRASSDTVNAEEPQGKPKSRRGTSARS
ncbi:Mif2/CENP-C like-domain-containing protein [Trametes meyenii]|nr:Mif2/CENP-C like-domain-containing protein [Trametes meyenii]